MLLASLAALLAAAAIALHSPRLDRRFPGSLGQSLRIASFLAAVLAVAVVSPAAFLDSPDFAAVAVAVPAALSLLPLLVNSSRRAVSVTTWVSALCLLGWALLLGLGIGMYFAPAALLMLGAAAVQRSRSQRDRGAPTTAG